jgi:hypothetical protein
MKSLGNFNNIGKCLKESNSKCPQHNNDRAYDAYLNVINQRRLQDSKEYKGLSFQIHGKNELCESK